VCLNQFHQFKQKSLTFIVLWCRQKNGTFKRHIQSEIITEKFKPSQIKTVDTRMLKKKVEHYNKFGIWVDNKNIICHTHNSQKEHF